MAGVLLNESQTIRGEDHPFLLVLAGTPDLPGTLRKSEAGFWVRSEICRLGQLSPEEAMQAITIPLEKAGVSFAPGVAEQIVERTDCYPYFIQVWGNYIAERLHQTGAAGNLHGYSQRSGGRGNNRVQVNVPGPAQ